MNAAQRVQDCRTTSSVNAYADGELEPSRAVEVEQHLVACRACREELELIKAVRHGLRKQTARPIPAGLAERLRLVAAAELEASQTEEARGRPSMVVAAQHLAGTPRTPSLKSRMSWGVTMTFAAAAGFVLAFFGSRSDVFQKSVGKPVATMDDTVAPPSPTFFARRPDGFDALLDRLVSFHANPPPPEVEDFDQAAHRFEPLVGVHMPGTTLRRPLGARFSGARIYDVDVPRYSTSGEVDDAHYTAAFRYTMQGHRITIYVFNPNVVPIQVTRLRPRVVRLVGASPTSQTQPMMASAPREVPVYVGRVRGFSVAAAEEGGIGYAVASDLDDDKSAQLVANF